MKLHKALKVKNRLVGEINQLKEILKRENSRRNDNTSKVDRAGTYQRILDETHKLVKLKTAISRANVDIYEAIQDMAETKLTINFLNSLPTRDGEEVSFVGRDQEKLVYTWTAYLNREEIDLKVAELQTKLGVLQDKVDLYNANTEINFQE